MRRECIVPADGSPRVFWTRVDGLKVFAREFGPADAPPVVLVHGVAVSGRYMLPTARELALRGFRVLVPDLPGSGYSDKPWPPLGVTAQADLLLGWLDAIPVPGAIDFAGNSFGCQVLIEAACRHPRRMAHLILQGPTVDPRHRTLRSQFWALLQDLFREPAVVRFALPDYLRTGPLRVFAMGRIAMADRPEEKLSCVALPALVVRGERDPLASAEWADALVESLPDGELKTMAGAAHAINYGYPQAFAEAVAGFIAQ